jgi:hypothetical protein
MTPSTRLLVLSALWHPRKMFAAADLGTIQNPSNLPSIYQESTGVTAGAVGSLAGLVLDERYQLVRGADQITNGSAFVDTTGWSGNANATLSVNAGALRITAVAGGSSAAGGQAVTTVIGRGYEVTARLVTPISGVNAFLGAGPTVGNASLGNALMGQAAGSFRLVFVATATTTYVQTSTATGITAGQFIEVDDITCKEIQGSHAQQSTAGSRPTLNTGKINYSSGTKSLVTTWASSLGSACTVAHAIPQADASILTAQTIGTTYTDTTDHCGLVIINRALTATETNQLRRWLNRLAG